MALFRLFRVHFNSHAKHNGIMRGITIARRNARLAGALQRRGTPDAHCYIVYVLNGTLQHTAGEDMARFTNFKKDGIARLVGDGFSLVQACEEVGISRSAVYKTMRQDEEFDAAIREAQRQSAEKALEELDGLYDDALHKRKDYDPHVLRDYANHVRWKVSKIIPEKFGEAKARAGVEVADGVVRVVWEE